MIEFWTIALLIFIVVTFILAKLTLKKQKEEMGDRVWRLWHGRSTYWRLLALTSFGITIGIMIIIHWLGIPILP
jgi:membrane protein required for beta-lactamase induction